MIALTTPVAIPNITRIELLGVSFVDDASIAVVRIAVRSAPAGNRVREIELTVRNGVSLGLAVNATPRHWNDSVETGPVTTPTGYDTLEAAYSGGTKPARKRAVESALLTLGVIGASLAGTVS